MKIAALLFLLTFTNPEIENVEAEVIPLSGIVVEASTGEPLPGATVYIKGIEKKLFTDFEGKFYIDALKPGTYDIEVSFVSFEEEKLSQIHIDHMNNSLLVSLD